MLNTISNCVLHDLHNSFNLINRIVYFGGLASEVIFTKQVWHVFYFYLFLVSETIANFFHVLFFIIIIYEILSSLK